MYWLNVYCRCIVGICDSDGEGTFYHLNAELNPICHLLALLGAHHILHVSRLRVKLAVEFYRYTRCYITQGNTVHSQRSENNKEMNLIVGQ